MIAPLLRHEQRRNHNTVGLGRFNYRSLSCAKFRLRERKQGRDPPEHPFPVPTRLPTRRSHLVGLFQETFDRFGHGLHLIQVALASAACAAKRRFWTDLVRIRNLCACGLWQCVGVTREAIGLLFYVASKLVFDLHTQLRGISAILSSLLLPRWCLRLARHGSKRQLRKLNEGITSGHLSPYCRLDDRVCSHSEELSGTVL